MDLAGKIKRYFTNQSDLWIYSILITISAGLALLAIKNIVLSADSMTYGLVSQQIISGNGIREPIMWFDSNAIPVAGTVPMLMHPPLFPILLAVFGGLTPQSLWAAQIVNLICHVVIAIFTFLLMKNLYKSRWIALLSGIIVSVSFPLLKAAHHIWSEPFFIALTTASIYFLTVSRHFSGSKFRTYIFIASILGSAAILTRNAGIAIIAVFFWEAFVLLKNKRSELKKGLTILSLTLPVITISMLYARNFIISGLIRGHVQFIVENSYLSALRGTIRMLFLQFELGYRSSLAIIVITILFISYVLINANSRKYFIEYFRSGLDLIIIFLMSYTALIVFALAEKQPRFELRFMFPLVPFLIITSIFAVVFIWDMIKLRGFLKLSTIGLALSFSLISFFILHKTFSNSSDFFYKQTALYAILDSCTYKYLKNNYGKAAIITTNQPYHLSFLGGYSTLRLPYRKFITTERIPEDIDSALPNRMLKIGSPVLVLFKPVEELYNGSYITQLFNKRENRDRFSLAYECSDGVIYNLKE